VSTFIDNWRIVVEDEVGHGATLIRVHLPVSEQTVATVTASEYDPREWKIPRDRVRTVMTVEDDYGAGGSRFIGKAVVWVSNLACHGSPENNNAHGYVEFLLHVDGLSADDDPIYVMFDISRLHPAKVTEVLPRVQSQL